MQLTSPSFEHEGPMPRRHSCEGDHISPALQLTDVPAATASLVLIMDDPDVPLSVREDGMFDHWIVYDIPPDVDRIAEGEEPAGQPGLGTVDNAEYFGPCPPDSKHRYYFKIYALSESLDLPARANKQQVEAAMQDLVLDRAELMGTYECDDANKRM